MLMFQRCGVPSVFDRGKIRGFAELDAAAAQHRLRILGAMAQRSSGPPPAMESAIAARGPYPLRRRQLLRCARGDVRTALAAGPALALARARQRDHRDPVTTGDLSLASPVRALRGEA